MRFSLTAAEPEPAITNSWGGWPSGGGLAPYVVVRVTVAGAVDPRTGYLCNITEIDRVVRARVIPAVRSRWESAGGDVPCAALLPEMAEALAAGLPAGIALVAVTLQSTPYLWFVLDLEEPSMVRMTQSFEFAAAHRLFCADLSAEENQRVFGKCTNPNGHGHNYMVEVTVAGEPDARCGVVIEMGRLEQTVKARVIDVFDHKHLNEDCAEFAALNPSVENITRVIWSKLEGQFAPAKLACVRVYETPKTYAEVCE
ncbi:MAG TPA: 6-carboxytetrahydropterin synthase [Phycisphaerae bacterium]|nr:6-carboxytetrahydropterin synthase [Phycisphaerae bacterium]